MKSIWSKDRPAFAPVPLPPEDVKPREPAGDWARKIWQTLTGPISSRREYPRAELPMTCGVHNRPFTVVAELRGETCFFVDNLVANATSMSGSGTACAAPSQSVGSFRYFDAHPQWRCPHCGARENSILQTHLIWFCCNKMICAGSIGRGAYCACGYYAERHFTFAKAGDSNARWDICGTPAGLPAPDGGGLLLPPPRLLLSQQVASPPRQLPPSKRRLPPPPKQIGKPR